MKERDEFEDFIQNNVEGHEARPPRSVWNEVKKDINSGNSGFNSSLIALGGIMGIILMVWMYSKYNGQQHVDPSTEIAMKVNDKIIKGKKLYDKECVACHKVETNEDLTGPSLCGVTKKRSKEWLIAFTKNSQQMIASGDPDALNLWNKWQPTVMQDFEHLSDEDLDCIYSYIDNTYYNCSPKKSKNIYVNENRDTVSGDSLFDVKLQGPVDSLLNNGEFFHEEREMEEEAEF